MHSGVASLMNTLDELKRRDIKGRIVASSYLHYTQPLALKRLLYNFPNITLRVIEDENFHAKGYLFRKGSLYNLIIGSSNLSSQALSTNKEWNLKVSATESSYLIKKTIIEFQYSFERATSVTNDWLIEYTSLFEKKEDCFYKLSIKKDLFQFIKLTLNTTNLTSVLVE